MNTKELVFAILASSTLSMSKAQWNSLPGGNVINTNEWLGADALSTIPLHLRTIPNLSIDQSTSNVLRSRLYPIQTSNFNANYTAVQQDGFFALSGQPNFFTQATSPGAFSRLHLVDPAGNGGSSTFYAPTAAYRGWMRNGMTMTGNADMGYLGQKYNANDRTDMVLHWSNDAGTLAFAPDRLRFMFSTAQDGAASGATSIEGLEAARFYPPRATEVYMGLGDFFEGNLLDPTNVTEPTERFDVLNGRVRLRQLPDPDQEADGTYKVMVVDDAALPNAERGVVKWVDPSVFVDDDCEWTMNGTSPHHVYTAVGTADPDCPDNAEAVGIGVDLSSGTPPAKLNLSTNTFDRGLQLAATMSTTENRGFNVDVSNATLRNYGGYITLSGTTASNRGLAVNTSGATTIGYGGDFVCGDDAAYAIGAAGLTKFGTFQSFGLQGTTRSDARDNFGVFGRAEPVAVDHGQYFYGVYGESRLDDITRFGYGVFGRAPAQAQSWAGYFDGDVQIDGVASCTAMAWTSDESLKTEIEELTGARALLMQVRARNYRFRTLELPNMNLPTGLQRGVVAQELEEVMPELVREIIVPPVLSEDGTEIEPARAIKGVNYVGLIPVIVAAEQEQQALVDAIDATQSTQAEELETLRATVQDQQERLDRMEERLASCCARVDTDALRSAASSTVALATDPATDRKLRIVPNPFSEPPMVYYTLDRGGRMQLFANSADGKELRVLHEAALQAGEYQYAWDTSALAPGMYYVSLLLDGQTLVKKAVKVDR